MFAHSYLIFVVFFTQAKFLENKKYTKKRVNYDKLNSKMPILGVNYNKLHSKLPIFRVKSVAPVTNMRYVSCMGKNFVWTEMKLIAQRHIL